MEKESTKVEDYFHIPASDPAAYYAAVCFSSTLYRVET
jgi:hypothetical protein